MIKAGKCPRCIGGNMFLETHPYRHLECLQCSFEIDLSKGASRMFGDTVLKSNYMMQAQFPSSFRGVTGVKNISALSYKW